MIQEIYLLVASFENARVFALIISCLVSGGLGFWIWSTAKHANLPLTTFGWVQVYIFGLISFFSGCLVMGYLIVPKNADKMMDMLGVARFVDFYTRQVQSALMFIVNLAR